PSPNHRLHSFPTRRSSDLADKMVRRISASEKHIKELEFEYKTVKSDVIYRSKASLLAKAVENLGLKELTSPPMLLTDDKNENGRSEEHTSELQSRGHLVCR